MAHLPILKVVLAGEGNVGKTSLIRRYCEGRFEQSRVATIGVDFQTQTVPLPGGPVKLSIWDMAGQDRFAVVRTGFYRGSRAAALVYDVTDAASLPKLLHWREEILNVVPGQRFVIVGNKIDLRETRTRLADHAQLFADRIEAPYLETSARSGQGVRRLFEALARLAAGLEPPPAADSQG